MEQWGPAIYSDDLASDIRHEYRILISYGKSNQEAEQMLMEYYASILGGNDPDEASFWFSLALTEWKMGRLSEFAKGKALEMLDSKRDDQRWNTPWLSQYAAKRKLELEKLRKTLLSEQPPEKNIRKEAPHKIPVRAGDLVAYQIKANNTIQGHPLFHKFALLRVLLVDQERRSKLVPEIVDDGSAWFGLYGWCGSEIPSPEIVQDLEYIAFEESKEESARFRRIAEQQALKAPEQYRAIINDTIQNLCNPIETRATSLSWYEFRSREAKGVIRCIGHDDSYEQEVPEWFHLGRPCILESFHTLDYSLARRLLPYYEFPLR